MTARRGATCATVRPLPALSALPALLALMTASLVAAPLRAADLAAAPTSGRVHLEAFTSPELHARIAAGATTVLVPIGGTEQNGPHMVLGKHNVRVRALAERIALRLGDAIVAPVMAYVPQGRIDPPEAHMRFAGTIGIDEAAFESVLASTARSLRRHGFRDIVFVGDHGGYRRSLERVAARLEREWRTPPATRVHALPEYYRAAVEGHAAQLRARGFGADEIGAHAGLADTSLALAVDPSLVRAERLADARRPDDGVSGDPRRASAALGLPGVEHVVDVSVAAIRARRGH